LRIRRHGDDGELQPVESYDGEEIGESRFLGKTALDQFPFDVLCAPKKAVIDSHIKIISVLSGQRYAPAPTTVWRRLEVIIEPGPAAVAQYEILKRLLARSTRQVRS
jgi:hypothetical protein